MLWAHAEQDGEKPCASTGPLLVLDGPAGGHVRGHGLFLLLGRRVSAFHACRARARAAGRQSALAHLVGARTSCWEAGLLACAVVAARCTTPFLIIVHVLDVLLAPARAVRRLHTTHANAILRETCNGRARLCHVLPAPAQAPLAARQRRQAPLQPARVDWRLLDLALRENPMARGRRGARVAEAAGPHRAALLALPIVVLVPLHLPSIGECVRLPR
mmetsp:Transcript_37496/g.98909  ORF Transcript_37496/g.98909 Transcript_37496/m.98909 type:complete len:217 (+) Transcript_37496:99-749(+)